MTVNSEFLAKLEIVHEDEEFVQLKMEFVEGKSLLQTLKE
jgi:hypothetical protein